MIHRQGNQDFTSIDRSPSESCTLHLPQIAEPVSVQKFLDRLMQFQVDPALLGRQICQILATSFDRELLLLQIANTLGVAWGADFCLVTAVVDRKVVHPNAYWQNSSDFPYVAGVADSTETPEPPQTTRLKPPSISLEHPVWANVLADGEIVGISDYLDIPAASSPNSPVTALPFRAILAGPARFGGAVNGMMIVGKSQPHEWSVADRQRLEAASDAIGSAISHIQKTQEIASLNEQLQRQVKYKNLLISVAASIDTNSEVDRILQQVIENTVDTLEVDRGQILLLKYTDPLFTTRSPNQTAKAKVELVCESVVKKDPNKQAIAQSLAGKKSSTSKTKNKDKTTNSQSKIPNSKPNHSPAFWLSESNLCQQAFHSAPKPLALADAGALIGKEQEAATEILKLQGIRGLLLVPLTGGSSHETVLGFLVLQHSEPRTWNPEELEVLESVSAQASKMIIQTQTFKELQTAVFDRTAQLQQSLDVQGKLYEQSATQLEQMRKLKLIKDEFLSTLSHELRTPLTIMKLAILMLKQAEQPSANRTKYLDILEQQCSKETSLVNDLLALKQFEPQQFPISLIKIDLNRLFQDLAGDFEKEWADKQLTLKLDLPKLTPCWETDPDILNRVLLELLTNAGKYSASGTAVVLEASEAAGYIVLSISNFGRGISAADLPHIFDKFRRGTGITDQAIAGTGLGLALVKSLVQHLNGTIEVSSCPAESSEAENLWRTSFTLTLPQFAAELCNVEE
ncbi:GAF sensor signal transduction histidine kinase [Oscillatoria nigro-viridis PCC 7112]|uniref:histidine kinase n=1 Tax=Phormidium nigroviride PCC 7112 TaxID=179408 RepID=K9VPX6_9CYAN|nr:ATP-binding protein [Oscillatoria nigro-viridis]AFZ09532.1 GAF sensor signal transduction histidine kinase [Oscillatoria nigro-viridis PCC 7112]